MSLHGKFKNRTPESSKKKEIFVIMIAGAIILSSIFIYTYAINYPIELSNFPSINIVTEDEIKFGEYTDCTVEVDRKDGSNVKVLNGRIKIRGHTNAKDKIPKKEYRLELNQRKSLLGMRIDDDWLLLAMYFDFPRMRVKMSFDIYRSLYPTNPTAILPDSEYVSLYMDGNFQGLYLLAEEIDRRLLGFGEPQNNNQSSLLFQIQRTEDLTSYVRSKWDQDWPNEDEGYYIIDSILPGLIEFISGTDDNDFFDSETGIYSKFDKTNLIDFLIFNILIDHKDFWDTNYYIARNSYPSKFFLVPWDFDGSFGQRGWVIFSSRENNELNILHDNYLYRRLLNNEDFRQDCSARWEILRDVLWTEEFIIDMLTDIYEDNKPLIELDTRKWKPITVEHESLIVSRYLHSTKEFNLKEYVDELFQFIPKRLEFCDDYFNNL
jgi:hypothetical protein